MNVMNRLEMWEAVNSEGEPICIVGRDFQDAGYSLNLYLDDDDLIVGVEVWNRLDNGDLECLSVVGDIPEGRLEEIAYEEGEDEAQEDSGEDTEGIIELWTRTETGMITLDGKSFEYETTFTAVD